jgi:hypothetical protein
MHDVGDAQGVGMINQKLHRQFIMPTMVPIGVIVATGVVIVVVGEILLKLSRENPSSDLARPELWAAVGFALVVLFGCAFVATRPPGTLGKLDEELAIGRRPLLAEPLPPVDVLARRGELGTLNDIAPGYTLYARNGALAKAIELLPTAREQYGHLRQGLIYAQGLFGANDELWIPGEAVSAVYPETQSAFLAIAGDEIEALGWHRPPAAFRRTAPKEEQKLY